MCVGSHRPPGPAERYRSYRAYLGSLFPWRVYKIPLDAGFSCPNRDGTVASGGCTFCDNASFSPFSSGPRKSISRQLEEGIRFYSGKRFGGERFIAYFQSFTNTYAPVAHLEKLYKEALLDPRVVGLAIGTRPDCVGEEVLDLLVRYRDRTQLSLELGLQSIHDATLRAVNRGHTAEQFWDAVNRVSRRGIRLCVHVILGLPGEGREEFLLTVESLARCPIDGIKFTHFYVPAGAPIAARFRSGEIATLRFEQYVELICEALERLPPRVVIERLMGEISGPDILAPRWGKSKSEILGRINARLQERESYQGARYSQGRR